MLDDGGSMIGGAVAWLIRRRDSRKDPIPKESAAVALSKEAVGIMQGVADELRSDLASLRAEQARQRAEHEKSNQRIEALQTTVSILQSSLSAAARFIERLLRWADADQRPPRPGLPAELREFIDPELH